MFIAGQSPDVPQSKEAPQKAEPANSTTLPVKKLTEANATSSAEAPRTAKKAKLPTSLAALCVITLLSSHVTLMQINDTTRLYISFGNRVKEKPNAFTDANLFVIAVLDIIVASRSRLVHSSDTSR